MGIVFLYVGITLFGIFTVWQYQHGNIGFGALVACLAILVATSLVVAFA